MDFSFAHANSSQEIPSDEMTQNMSMLGRHLGPRGGGWGVRGGGGGDSKGGQKAAEGQRSELKRVCSQFFTGACHCSFLSTNITWSMN